MRYIDDELRDQLFEEAVLRYRTGAAFSMLSAASRLTGVISAVRNVAKAYHESTLRGAPASDALQVLELLCIQVRVCNRDLESAVLSLAIGHGRPAVGSDVLAELYDQVPLLRLFDTPPEDGEVVKKAGGRTRSYLSRQEAFQRDFAVPVVPESFDKVSIVDADHEAAPSGEKPLGSSIDDGKQQRIAGDVNDVVLHEVSEGCGIGHDSSSPVGDGCRSLCNPTGEVLTHEERCQLVGACFCLISALQGQGSVGGSGGVRDGFDRYAQHRDLIGKVTKHLALGGQLSPVARKFLKRDLAYLIGEISLQSFDAFQRIFDGIEFVHNSSSPVGDGCGSLCKPTGEGSTSSVSGEGVE